MSYLHKAHKISVCTFDHTFHIRCNWYIRICYWDGL